MKKLAQPTRSFFTLKISWKTSPGWLQLVFHFGTENRADQLKKTPCIYLHMFQRCQGKSSKLQSHLELGRTEPCSLGEEEQPSWNGLLLLYVIDLKGLKINNVFVSSVRSSNSHPDLLVIHPTPPTFSDHTGPQHWTCTFWATTAI